jgi:hypothetical protein
MKRVLASIAVLLAASVALVACSASFSTASISSAVLAKDVTTDNKPVDPTTTFPVDQPVIHLVVTLKNVPSDTTLKAVWTAVDVGDAAAANTKIDELEKIINDSGSIDFTLSVPSTGVWPVGTYKVELYLDGKLDTTLEFFVAASRMAV